MIKSEQVYQTYRVARHASGKRLIIGNDQRLFTTASKLATALSVGETSARDIINGERRKGWQIVPMQRRRENMRISYTLTNAGKQESTALRIKTRKGLPDLIMPLSAFQVFLQHIEKGEASDISEVMLQAGYPAWNRQRVLIEGIKACRLGFAKQTKETGAIFGHV